MVKLRNTTDNEIVVQSKLFRPAGDENDTHEVPEVSRILWANDNDVISNIADGSLILSLNDVEITESSKAINTLKNSLPIEISDTSIIKTYALAEGNTLRARLIGIINEIVTKNQETIIDWQIPQTSYIGINKQSYMDGIEYFAKNAEIGDTMTLQVIDKDALVYPANTVLDEFGLNWAVMPETAHSIKLYKAKLIPGMYIRIKYTSTGTANDIYLVCNLFRHMDTNVDL